MDWKLNSCTYLLFNVWCYHRHIITYIICYYIIICLWVLLKATVSITKRISLYISFSWSISLTARAPAAHNAWKRTAGVSGFGCFVYVVCGGVLLRVNLHLEFIIIIKSEFTMYLHKRYPGCNLQLPDHNQSSQSPHEKVQDYCKLCF